MRKSLAVYLVAAIVLFGGLMAGPPNVQLIAYTATALLSAGAVVVGVRAHRPQHRAPWVLLTAAVAMFAVVGVLTWLELTVWDLNWLFTPVDIALLAGYTLLVVAFWSIARRMSLTRDRGALLDITLLLVGGSVVVYQLVLQPIFTAHHARPLVQLSLVVYPLLDYALLVLLARILLTPGRRPAALFVLVAAMSVGALTDLMGAAISAADPQADVSFFIIGGVLSLVLVGVAALLPSMADLGRHQHDAGPTLGWVRLAAIGTALGLPALTTVAAAPSGAIDASMLLGPTAIMIVLVVSRVRLLFRSLARTSRDIERRQEYFESLVNNITDIVLVTDVAGVVADRTDSASVVLGAGVGSASIVDRVVPDDLVGIAVLLDDAAQAPGRPVHGEARLLDVDGGTRHYEIVVRDLTGTDAVGGVVWVLHDVSAQKDFEARLRHQAMHDALTGLPNRALFADRLDWARSRRDRAGVAVLFVDLDDFKSVNDSLGHEAGDDLLREVADRLRGAVRSEDTVARLGGDEFAVLIEGEASAEHVRTVAERVVAAFGEPFTIAGSRLVVTASVGGAVVDESDDRDADVLALADAAMYQAKAEGKNGWTLFRDGADGTVHKRVDDTELLCALERDELRLHYQPIVTVAGHRVVGVEALLRWEHPTKGLLAPASFLPTAEQNGLIVPIGRFVLREACRQAVEWIAEHGTLLTMAVNVSARHLDADSLLDDVRAALDDSGLPAEQLVIEVTETALVRDMDQTRERLEALRGLGVQVAIDDFGTGYSSLSYLGRLPVDILKIDRSLVADMLTSPAAATVVRAVVDLGHALGLETVAEGVEDATQASALHQDSCDLGQGFFFARPQPPEKASELLRAAFEIAVR